MESASKLPMKLPPRARPKGVGRRTPALLAGAVLVSALLVGALLVGGLLSGALLALSVWRGGATEPAIRCVAALRTGNGAE